MARRENRGIDPSKHEIYAVYCRKDVSLVTPILDSLKKEELVVHCADADEIGAANCDNTSPETSASRFDGNCSCHQVESAANRDVVHCLKGCGFGKIKPQCRYHTAIMYSERDSAIYKSSIILIFLSDRCLKCEICKVKADVALDLVRMQSENEHRLVCVMIESCKVPISLRDVYCCYVWHESTEQQKLKIITALTGQCTERDTSTSSGRNELDSSTGDALSAHFELSEDSMWSRIKRAVVGFFRRQQITSSASQQQLPENEGTAMGENEYFNDTVFLENVASACNDTSVPPLAEQSTNNFCNVQQSNSNLMTPAKRRKWELLMSAFNSASCENIDEIVNSFCPMRHQRRIYE